jgi:2-polyprenyl-3-methyl-5-hydroxy-6-metoxy-1,4-benzoquinol methylase
MNTPETPAAVFNRRASDYQDKFMDISLYSDSLDLFCEHVKGKEILEIACGPGNITKYLLNKRPDFRILGVDVAENMIELAKSNNAAAEFRLMDARDIISLNKKYDGIMCGFLLPYLSKEDTSNLIQNCSLLLKQGAPLYLSTMEDDYNKSGIKSSSYGDKLFMYYHEEGFLRGALEKNFYQIIDVQRKSYPGSDNTTITDLLILASQK